MSNTPIMKAGDAVNGALARCYMTIDGERYNFMQLIKFESKMTKKVSEVPILGKPGKGHKSAGWSGTWSATAHYNQSVLRRLLLYYKRTGIDPDFEIQVTNEDEGSSIGRQTVVHMGCLTEGGVLAKFDTSAEYLDEEISGTFDDFDLPEQFRLIDGMQ